MADTSKTLKMIQMYIGYDYTDNSYYITNHTLAYIINTHNINLYLPRTYHRVRTTKLIIRNNKKWWEE